MPGAQLNPGAVAIVGEDIIDGRVEVGNFLDLVATILKLICSYAVELENTGACGWRHTRGPNNREIREPGSTW